MEFADLPERMEVSVLRSYFVRFLNCIRDGSISLESALHQLKELTYRQWYTFELLDEEIRQNIDDWLIQIWDSTSVEKADIVTFIVANLGLTRTFAFLEQEYHFISSEQVREIVAETISELKESIADPYQEMREYIVI